MTISTPRAGAVFGQRGQPFGGAGIFVGGREAALDHARMAVERAGVRDRAKLGRTCHLPLVPGQPGGPVGRIIGGEIAFDRPMPAGADDQGQAERRGPLPRPRVGEEHVVADADLEAVQAQGGGGVQDAELVIGPRLGEDVAVCAEPHGLPAGSTPVIAPKVLIFSFHLEPGWNCTNSLLLGGVKL